ncbi:MAG TPA: alpha/beta fold hydrolase [Usitatibacter sp.]|nr:alpha/beta fold hydrolase [Usitatibacter sp.]
MRPSAARGPLVIYFGGNAEEVTESAHAVPEAHGDRAVLLVNYRGYGKSAGTPGEKALVADAIEIYDWAAKRPDVDPGRIAVHGRSLGSGVAVQLAAARPVRCVVLTTPFSSALDVARSAYPWLPVALLMRHPFDSIAHAPSLKMPMLVLMGEEDRVIPIASSERLASAWGGPVERLRLPGFGHNDIGLDPRYNATVKAFLDRNL